MDGECPMCDGKHQLVLLIKDVNDSFNDSHVLYCKICKVGFTIPFPSSPELLSMYSSGSYRADSGKRIVGSEMGVAGLIGQHGFQFLKIRRFNLEYNPFGWLQPFPNGSKWHLLATIVLTPVYLPVSLILSLFESFILKNGGTMEIHSVKA